MKYLIKYWIFFLNSKDPEPDPLFSLTDPVPAGPLITDPPEPDSDPHTALEQLLKTKSSYGYSSYGMFALLWLEREMEEWSVTMRSEVDAVLLRTQYTIR